MPCPYKVGKSRVMGGFKLLTFADKIRLFRAGEYLAINKAKCQLCLRKRI